MPETLQKFRDKIEKELNSEDGLKSDYKNYKEVIEKKGNFINENFQQLVNGTLPKLSENIQNGIRKAIEESIYGIIISYDKGKMVIKEKPSMKEAGAKVAGGLGVAAVGAGIAYYVGTTALVEAFAGGVVVVGSLIEPSVLAGTGLFALVSKGGLIAGLISLASPIGWFALAGTGVVVSLAGISYAFIYFSDRKKEAYCKSIKSLKEKFFSLYNGFEKKVINQYNAMKEQILERAAYLLNMCYYPVELSESQRESLLNKYDCLQREINNLIKN